MDDPFVTQASSVEKKQKSSSPQLKNGGNTIASSNFETRKLRYITRDTTRFGASAPMWTIHGGREDGRPPIPTPGPGSYEIPNPPYYGQPAFTIKDRRSYDFTRPVSNLDYAIEHQFPQIRKISIGSRTPLKTFDPDIKAEPVFVYHKEKNTKTYKISERYHIPQPDRVPSPSHYSPIDLGQQRTIVYSLPKKEKFSPVTFSEDEDPGPGSYNLIVPLVRYTNWAQSLIPKNTRYKPPEKANPYKPWIVEKADSGEKPYVEFEMLETDVDQPKKDDVSK